MATQRSRVPSAARRTRTGARVPAGGGGGSGRTATRAAQKSNNTMMIVGGIASAIGLVIIISVLMSDSGGGGAKDAGAKTKPDVASSTNNPTDTTSKQPMVSVSLTAADRPGKTPAKVAPPIDPAKVARAEALYQESKAKSNDSVRARKAGDVDRSGDLLRSAWADIETMRAEIEAYNDWYNEADFEDWAIPGEYVALAKRFAVWDKHSAKVQKLKPR